MISPLAGPPSGNSTMRSAFTPRLPSGGTGAISSLTYTFASGSPSSTGPSIVTVVFGCTCCGRSRPNTPSSSITVLLPSGRVSHRTSNELSLILGPPHSRSTPVEKYCPATWALALPCSSWVQSAVPPQKSATSWPNVTQPALPCSATRV